MNKRDLARFRKIVDQEKQRLLKDLGVLGEGISALSSNQASGSQGYSNHMADIGTDAMEQEQAFLHASQGSDYLNALEAALKRIEDGSYGVCELCGGKIPLKRLEAYPAARLCITCKSQQERLQRG